MLHGRLFHLDVGVDDAGDKDIQNTKGVEQKHVRQANDG
jgi:hypothetical protein